MRVVTIASGKGGVGKSTVSLALALALALAERVHRVGLLGRVAKAGQPVVDGCLEQWRPVAWAQLSKLG
jgi:nitrogenase subunit NifH